MEVTSLVDIRSPGKRCPERTQAEGSTIETAGEL